LRAAAPCRGKPFFGKAVFARFIRFSAQTDSLKSYFLCLLYKKIFIFSFVVLK